MTPLRRLVAAPVLVSDPDLTRLNTAQSTGIVVMLVVMVMILVVMVMVFTDQRSFQKPLCALPSWDAPSGEVDQLQPTGQLHQPPLLLQQGPLHRQHGGPQRSPTQD